MCCSSSSITSLFGSSHFISYHSYYITANIVPKSISFGCSYCVCKSRNSCFSVEECYQCNLRDRQVLVRHHITNKLEKAVDAISSDPLTTRDVYDALRDALFAAETLGCAEEELPTNLEEACLDIVDATAQLNELLAAATPILKRFSFKAVVPLSP